MTQKLTGKQLFVLALVGLAILAGVAYVHTEYVPVLVGVVLTVFGVATHINGVNTGVPLQPISAVPTATATLVTSVADADAAPASALMPPMQGGAVDG